MKLIIIILLFASILYAQDDIVITIGGDVMFDRGTKTEIQKSGRGKFFGQYKKFFNDSDFGIINLEGAVTNINKKTPKEFNFKGKLEDLISLRDIGVTHVNLANNHSIDYGACGLEETIENSRKANLIPFGFHNSKRDIYQPEIIEKNGIRVALFSSVMLKLPSYRNDTCSNIFLNHSNTDELIQNIDECHKKHLDSYIIVLLHHGWEDTAKVRKSQIAFAKKIIESGADLIVGCHPHVIQDIMKIEGKPVYFSIGNMIFDGKLKKGMILKVKLKKNKEIEIEQEIIEVGITSD